MQTIIVNTPGPRGPQGPAGPSGSIVNLTGSAEISGSLTVVGTVSASAYSGDGSGLSNLNIPPSTGGDLYLFYNY
jgi:hypothetical protein